VPRFIEPPELPVSTPLSGTTLCHFGDIPQANLLAWYGKTKPNTIKGHIHQSKEMYYNTK